MELEALLDVKQQRVDEVEQRVEAMNDELERTRNELQRLQKRKSPSRQTNNLLLALRMQPRPPERSTRAIRRTYGYMAR